MGIEVTIETLSNPFLISATHLKLVPYSENGLFLLVPGFKSKLPHQKGKSSNINSKCIVPSFQNKYKSTYLMSNSDVYPTMDKEQMKPQYQKHTYIKLES